MGSFAWVLSPGSCHLPSCFGILPLRSLAYEFSCGFFRLGSSVWNLSFGISRLVYFTVDLAFGKFRLVRISRSDTVGRDLSLGIGCLDLSELSLALFHFVTLVCNL